MKRQIVLLLLLLTFGLFGCIENDVPYPVIHGKVESIEFNGQKETVIVADKREINTIINDTVDIRRVKVKSIKVTDDALSSLIQGDVLDLTKPYKFTITTYQQYDWVINATQPIDRKLRVENQVGEAEIGVINKTVRVKVTTDQDLRNINILEMQLGPSRSVTLPDYKLIHNFTVPQKFTVTYFDITEDWTVYISQTAELVSTKEPEVWAKFAYLNGIGITTGTTPSFEWKKSEDQEWNVVPFDQISVAGGSFSTKLAGLEPSTAYIYRAVVGEDRGAEISFTTEAAPLPPNMNLNTWTLAGKTWYPNDVAENNYWATGNEGVTKPPVSKDSNTTPTDDAVEGKAARMETVKVPVVNIAAGNLLTGTYKTNLTNPASSVTMGRPYTGRPTTFSGWYKYTPRKINVDKDNKHPEAMNTDDACHIYIRLENWGAETVRPPSPIVIAKGELKNDKTVAAYTKFTIDVSYIDLKTKPTHIVLVATSSVYGDDFCGGIGSILFIDQLELGFD